MSGYYSHKLQLPSRGRYGKAFVKVRQPVLEDLWAYLSYSGSSVSAKNEFVKSLCDTDLSEYPTGDRDYVFISIRNMVTEPVISGNLTCTDAMCGAEVPYWYDVRKAKVSQLPNDFERDFTMQFPGVAVEKSMNVLTVQAEELLEEYVGLYETADSKDLPNSDLGEDLYTFGKYACLFGDSTDPDKVDENVSLLRKFTMDDMKLLLFYDVTFKCEVDLTVEAKCEACGKQYRIKLREDSSFFGLSLGSLLKKHSFLARSTNIGFQDFLKYSIQDMKAVAEQETDRIQQKAQRKKKV